MAGDSPPVLARSARSSESWTATRWTLGWNQGPIRVRLYAVDAPEKAQPHGKEAAAALSALVSDKLEPFRQDRYKRLGGIVYLGELNVNAELIRKGHA